MHLRGMGLPCPPCQAMRCRYSSHRKAVDPTCWKHLSSTRLRSTILRVSKNHASLIYSARWRRRCLFLRETAPANLYLADVMNEAIRHLHTTNNPCRIIRNQKKPPIEGVPEGIDLVFAFSVFSHFSEEYLRLWVEYFFDILRPGGCVVFTTRGRAFIEHLQNLHETANTLSMKENVRRLREEMPSATQISERYAEGAFSGSQWDGVATSSLSLIFGVKRSYRAPISKENSAPSWCISPIKLSTSIKPLP